MVGYKINQSVRTRSGETIVNSLNSELFSSNTHTSSPGYFNKMPEAYQNAMKELPDGYVDQKYIAPFLPDTQALMNSNENKAGKKTKKLAATALFLAMAACGHDTPIPPADGQALMQFVDMNGQPVIAGQVITNKGGYAISNGQSVVEWSDNDNAATIVTPGYVQRGTFAENKTYIMIPNNWNAFFADMHIAGFEGTNKFAGTIKYFIDGPTNDDDYNRVKSSFENMLNQCELPHQQVFNSGEENYVIHLNETHTNHGEVYNNGIISRAFVYLEDKVIQAWIDHEMACGLVHCDEALGVPEPSVIASSSEWSGFRPADVKIIKAIYNRTWSLVSLGSEQERK